MSVRRRQPNYNADWEHLNQYRSESYRRLLEAHGALPSLGAGLLKRSKSEVDARSEAELKWACSRIAVNTNLTLKPLPQNSLSRPASSNSRGSLRVGTNSSSAQRPHSSAGLGFWPEDAGSLTTRAGFPLDLSTGQLRLESLRELPRISTAPAKLQPGSQSFLELTAGVPLETRVRWIPFAEHRGIMVKQLELLLDFIVKRSNPKTHFIQGWVDKTTGDQLRLKSVSLSQVLHWLVVPMTRSVRCSYVEAVTFSEESQKPTWFVCHYWGEPIADFVAGVKKHAQTRYPSLCGVTGAYWVSAFAMNLHKSSETAVSLNVQEMSFYKAMCDCTGVLLVLASGGPSTTFKRLWCCYELSVASQQLDHLMFDIATTHLQGEERISKILIDGLTQVESKKLAAGELDQSSVWTLKTEREASFPIEHIREGLTVDIRALSTSSPGDRISILKAMSPHKEEFRFELDLGEPIYEEVNKRLRAKIASLCFRQTVQHGKKMAMESQIGFEMAKAIAGNPDLMGVNMNLASCWQMTNAGAECVAQSIPQTGAVRRASLNFGHCYQMTSVSPLLKTLSNLDNLQECNLSFENCTGLNSVEDLVDFGKELQNRRSSLRTVTMNFSGCDNLGPLDSFVAAMKRASIPNLQIIAPDGVDLAVEEKVERVAAKARPKKKAVQKWLSKTAKTWARRGSWVG